MCPPLFGLEFVWLLSSYRAELINHNFSLEIGSSEENGPEVKRVLANDGTRWSDCVVLRYRLRIQQIHRHVVADFGERDILQRTLRHPRIRFDGIAAHVRSQHHIFELSQIPRRIRRYIWFPLEHIDRGAPYL